MDKVIDAKLDVMRQKAIDAGQDNKYDALVKVTADKRDTGVNYMSTLRYVLQQMLAAVDKIDTDARMQVEDPERWQRKQEFGELFRVQGDTYRDGKGNLFNAGELMPTDDDAYYDGTLDPT